MNGIGKSGQSRQVDRTASHVEDSDEGSYQVVELFTKRAGAGCAVG